MLGRNCKAYYLNAAASTRTTWGDLNATSGRHEASAPPTLVEITSLKDVTLPGERDAAEISDRGADAKTEDTGAWGGRLTLVMNHRASDAARDALNAAFILNNPISLAILNGDKATAGSRGLWADFKVVKWEESQPEADHVVYNIDVALYDGPDGSGVAPEWVETISSV